MTQYDSNMTQYDSIILIKFQAFSFMAQNTLGHPEFTCNLMKSLNCRHDEINRADERTTFHVKG